MKTNDNKVILRKLSKSKGNLARLAVGTLRIRENIFRSEVV
jgi:hypothetical protein